MTDKGKSNIPEKVAAPGEMLAPAIA